MHFPANLQYPYFAMVGPGSSYELRDGLVTASIDKGADGIHECDTTASVVTQPGLYGFSTKKERDKFVRRINAGEEYSQAFKLDRVEK